MTITANGKPFVVDHGRTLDEFLTGSGQTPTLVVVERNGAALTPTQARQTVLEDGDVLEIVRIVAGG